MKTYKLAFNDATMLSNFEGEIDEKILNDEDENEKLIPILQEKIAKWYGHGAVVEVDELTDWADYSVYVPFEAETIEQLKKDIQAYQSEQGRNIDIFSVLLDNQVVFTEETE